MQNLLLADDSVTIQRVIELTFADEDIKVVAVSDGEQAIARLDSTPPDIVLVDVGMPGKSGYDVADYVKRTPRLSHIPVVLLTGAFEPVDEARANALGCDGVLSKPFEPQLVISRVKELLSREPNKPAEPAADSALTAELPAAADWASGVIVSPAPEAPPVNVAPATTPSNGDAAAKLDEYFDQLDSAFARFTNPKETPAFDSSLSLETPALPSGLQLPDSADLVQQIQSLEPPMVGHQIEPAASLATLAAHQPTAVSAPAAYTTTGPVREPRVATIELEPMVAVPSVPRDLPPLADAFAAILAAEREGSPAPSGWPSSLASAASVAPVITDEMIDRVSRRVIEQMTDHVVRDAVANAVSGVAERLVREEIERIKKAIE